MAELAQLSPNLLQSNTLPEDLSPRSNYAQLPEKILQFGTGVLLRGLCDFFVEKANRQNLFNGRIVVVKSTSGGIGGDPFEKQGGLFTHHAIGVEKGAIKEETFINASISRVLAAADEWEAIKAVAASPDVEIVISNTTEVGLRYHKEDSLSGVPKSFPAKLTALLYHRFQTLGSKAKGWVIIPTELLVDNGKLLQGYVKQHIQDHNLGESFQAWVERSCYFCSSLVDRIVPGKPAKQAHQALEEKLGYRDELLVESEWYRLWAIEGPAEVANILTFAPADTGVIVAEDISVYRERKLRLLNGTHTISVAYAFLKGMNTVYEMMSNPETAALVEAVAMEEIVPNIDVPHEIAAPFAEEVLDRFRNPHVVHNLINICFQYTGKMKARNVATLLNHYKKNGQPPVWFVKGFAAYLRLMRTQKTQEDGVVKYLAQRGNELFGFEDELAEVLHNYWQAAGENVQQLVSSVLADVKLWGENLSELSGFTEAVSKELSTLTEV